MTPSHTPNPLARLIGSRSVTTAADAPHTGDAGGPGAHPTSTRTAQATERYKTGRAALVASNDLSAVQRRTSLTDLTDRWLGHLLTEPRGVALMAVGGYGRRELLPGSDLDLVVLHDPRRGGRPISAVADDVFYPIWDSGVRLDHSVRTIAEVRLAASGNLKAMLGLLDARHVAGDQSLTDDARQMVLADWRQQARRRLPALREMVADRTTRYGDLAYMLEPDLVQAYGGLRDAVVLRALTASWLVDSAHGRNVEEARQWLLTVRDALHRVTGRRADVLLLEEQDAVAAMLGLIDADSLLRRVSEAARVLAHTSDHAWLDVARLVGLQDPKVQDFAAQPTVPVRRGSRRVAEPVAPGVVCRDGELGLARSADAATDPVLALRVAAAAAQRGLVMTPTLAARLAADSAPLPTPWPAAARQAFLELLGAGDRFVGVWETCDVAGLVRLWLPEWDVVRYRPQRNPLHRHTVDRHCAEAVARAAGHLDRTDRPDLLLVAALLHDIGKGRGRDHSVVGAPIAAAVAARMGFDAEDVATIEFLVREHLLLPEAATRRDLDDPSTISQVAARVVTADRLALLAALTESDASAAAPVAWTKWRAGLVRRLTARVAAVLGGAAPQGPAPMPEAILDRVRTSRFGVEVSALDADGICTVTVVAPDRLGLMATSAGVLALHRLDVRGAALDTFAPAPAAAAAAAATVASPDGSAATPAVVGGGVGVPGAVAVQQWRAVPQYGSVPDAAVLSAELQRALSGAGDVSARLRSRAAQRGARRLPVRAPNVRVVEGGSATATVLEIRAHDEVGLLHSIASAVAAAGVAIRSAVVETIGAEIIDVLYLVDPSGAPLDREQAGAVQDYIRAVLVSSGNPVAAAIDER